MMKFKLEKEILDQTECNDNFSCLHGDKTCLCEADQMIGNSLLNIKPVNNKACDYKILFGYSSYYCHCPIRQEIYKRYNF